MNESNDKIENIRKPPSIREFQRSRALGLAEDAKLGHMASGEVLQRIVTGNVPEGLGFTMAMVRYLQNRGLHKSDAAACRASGVSQATLANYRKCRPLFNRFVLLVKEQRGMIQQQATMTSLEHLVPRSAEVYREIINKPVQLDKVGLLREQRAAAKDVLLTAGLIKVKPVEKTPEAIPLHIFVQELKDGKRTLDFDIEDGEFFELTPLYDDPSEDKRSGQPESTKDDQ